jgi:hypothetical protein
MIPSSLSGGRQPLDRDQPARRLNTGRQHTPYWEGQGAPQVYTFPPITRVVQDSVPVEK